MIDTSVGFIVADTSTWFLFLAWATAMKMASTAAVAPSYMEALVQSMPVSSQMWLWYSKIYCKVPCEISGW